MSSKSAASYGSISTLAARWATGHGREAMWGWFWTGSDWDLGWIPILRGNESGWWIILLSGFNSLLFEHSPFSLMIYHIIWPMMIFQKLLNYQRGYCKPIPKFHWSASNTYITAGMVINPGDSCPAIRNSPRGGMSINHLPCVDHWNSTV